jgi:hypothetical protein
MERSHITRGLFALPIAALLITSLALPGPAMAGTGSAPYAILPTDTVGIATGGGTIDLGGVIVASFGINAKRPANFTSGGPGYATGRINYDKHATVTGGRHVSVPVTLMAITLSNTPTPNGTGGNATIVGSCEAQGSECPTHSPAYKSVLVYVEDDSDSGANIDIFQIQYCTDPGTSAFPSTGSCSAPEGGALRTGNIQIRPNSGGSGGMAPMAPIAGRRLP